MSTSPTQDVRTESDEIQSQMQRLIMLQNEQQKRQQAATIDTSTVSEENIHDNIYNTVERSSRSDCDVNNNSMSSVPYLVRLMPTTSFNTSPDIRDRKVQMDAPILHNSISNGDATTKSQQVGDDDDIVVGQGTLIWTGGSIGKNNSTNINFDMLHQGFVDDGDSSTSEDGPNGMNNLSIGSQQQKLKQQQKQHAGQVQKSSLPGIQVQNQELRQLFLGVPSERGQHSSNEATGLIQRSRVTSTQVSNFSNSKTTMSTTVTQANEASLFTSYGAVEQQTMLDPNTVPMPPGHHEEQSSRYLYYQHTYSDSAHPQAHEQQHSDRNGYWDEDGYNNTGRGIHDESILEHQLLMMQNGITNGKTKGRRNSDNNCLVQLCCSCLLIPIFNCIQDLLSNQSLHRSFCYGAIDGLLTGAGIVSTFCGMSMLQFTTTNTSNVGGFINATDAAGNIASSIPSFIYSSEIRAVIVVFTAATCFADAVCMALGHIWTTHVLASAHARERADARCQIIYRRNDAKGMLVDMLIQKGMLQIDAVSLADTLEGYPDLFVSALIGESLTTPNATQHLRPPTQKQQHYHSSREPILDEIVHTRESETNTSDVSSFPISETVFPEQDQKHHHPVDIREKLEDPPSTSVYSDSPSRHEYYHTGTDNRNINNDYNSDPDSNTIKDANQESRKESFFMMMGFSLFAVIPSLIFTWVPTLLLVTQQLQPPHSSISDFTTNTYTSSSSTATSPSSSSSNYSPMTYEPPFIDPNSLAIVLTTCIMWCLGVWKSQYVDSNWLVFGIESVSVLLVCIFCAYWIGALLNHYFLPNEYEITVITPAAPASAPSLQLHYFASSAPHAASPVH